MGIIGDVTFTDGYETRLTLLFNCGRRFYFDAGDAYLVVPWDDVSLMVHPLDEFMKAQEKARHTDVDKELENCRKALAPKHQADGFTWTEI